MKGKWIGLIVVCVVIIGGLITYSLVGNGEAEPVSPPVTDGASYLDVPLGEDFSISPGILLEKAVAPAYFEFGSVIPGATIDTWTRNGEVRLGAEQISYVPGQPLWLLLYNGKDSAVTFGLGVVNAPLEVNHSDITGKDYSRAPIGFLDGISIPALVTIPGGCCQKVPVSFQFPEDLDYPVQWEFRILVTDLQVPGTVGTGHEVRFFSTMR